MSILKEDWQALGHIVAKYSKKKTFSYHLTNYRLALSTVQGTLNKQRIKYLFRYYSIGSSASFVEIPPNLNLVVSYDAMTVICCVPSQATWESLFKILIKLCKLKASTETILVFNNYTNLNTL